MNAFRRTLALGLLISITILVLGVICNPQQESSCTNGNRMAQTSSLLFPEVPPEVTLSPGKNRTAVCEAIAGKPAAQISWTPEGHHVTKNESHRNGTVTVRSTYYWEQSNVSTVFCFVSHLTVNQTLSIEQNQGVISPLHSLLTILYAKLSLLGIILLIIGFVFFQKRNHFRKWKSRFLKPISLVAQYKKAAICSHLSSWHPTYLFLMSPCVLQVMWQLAVMQYEYTSKSLVLTILCAINDHIPSPVPASQAKEEDGSANVNNSAGWISFTQVLPEGLPSTSSLLVHFTWS